MWDTNLVTEASFERQGSFFCHAARPWCTRNVKTGVQNTEYVVNLRQFETRVTGNRSGAYMRVLEGAEYAPLG